MIDPEQGVLLIADPFLKDPNFMRSVIMICRHGDEGTIGFILNKTFELTLDNLIAGLEGFPITVYHGGPVQMDTVHFVHQYPDLIPDSQLIADDIFWGGDFEVVKTLITEKKIDLAKIKFFIGYSGWEYRQLDNELEEKSWLTATCIRSIVFDTPVNEIWKAGLRHLGGKYELMIHFPIDPQLN